MKKAVCHYSYHRTLKDQDWSLKDFVSQCEKLDVDGVDFHARFLPEPAEAPAAIKEVLSGSALELSGLSLSTNFNKEERDFEDEVAAVEKTIPPSAGADLAAAAAQAEVDKKAATAAKRKATLKAKKLAEAKALLEAAEADDDDDIAEEPAVTTAAAEPEADAAEESLDDLLADLDSLG